MIKAVLSIIWHVIVAAVELPFAIVNGLLQAFGFLPAPEPDHETPAIATLEAETNAYDSTADVRQWAESMLRGMSAIPSGPYTGWLLALDREDAAKIADADAAGRLLSHLEGSNLFPDLPPVMSYTETLDWKCVWAKSRLSEPHTHVEQHIHKPHDEEPLAHEEPSPAPGPL